MPRSVTPCGVVIGFGVVPAVFHPYPKNSLSTNEVLLAVDLHHVCVIAAFQVFVPALVCAVNTSLLLPEIPLPWQITFSANVSCIWIGM